GIELLLDQVTLRGRLAELRECGVVGRGGEASDYAGAETRISVGRRDGCQAGECPEPGGVEPGSNGMSRGSALRGSHITAIERDGRRLRHRCHECPSEVRPDHAMWTERPRRPEEGPVRTACVVPARAQRSFVAGDM